MDCAFSKTGEAAMKHGSSPLYKGMLICGEDLSISFFRKKKLRARQLWGVGFSILEISKYIMQRLYYKEIIPRLGAGRVSVVMSDTDSFLLEVKGWSEDTIMEKLKDVMDFSNLDKSHRLYDKSRCRAPGYLKNEMPGANILEVVALKSKTYSIRTRKTTKNKAKGVVKVVKNAIPFTQYKKCLKKISDVEITQNTLRSRNHINQMLRSNRVAFSSFDDKRYLLCSKHSVPYGSILIKKKMTRRCFFCKRKNVLL